MTIKSLYPNTFPTLDLNFARSKRLDSRITFTRASTGTFVGSNGLIQNAASNAARFDHNPTTGESLGLLVEEARTNLVTYSEQFDDAAWSKSGATITANEIAAPNGATTADKIVPSASSGRHVTNQNFTSSANVAYTLTCFAKAAEYSYLVLSTIDGSNSNGLGYIFDLSTGVASVLTVGTGFTGVTATTVRLPNGWYRCSLNWTNGTTGNIAGSFIIGTSPSNNPAIDFVYRTSSYTGDGTSGVYIWGAQLEAGSFPTSYIPTVASTVTRAADVASITGANFSSWHNQTAGTLFVNGVYIGDNNNSGDVGFLAVLDTTSNDQNFAPRPQLRGSNNTLRTWWNGSDGSTVPVQLTTALGSAARNVTHKIAAAFGGGTAGAAANGNISSTTYTASIFVPSRLKIGGQGAAYVTTCTIYRLTYYPVRLPDAQLIALTQ
jgi:hypothetical protein